MNLPRTGGLALLLTILGACGSTKHKVADFAANPEIYAGLDYTTRLPGDRSVFLAPVADQRQNATLPSHDGSFPVVYDDDARWSRSVPEMLDEVLRTDLQHSRVFTEVVDAPTKADIVIQPALVTFVTGAMELETGSRAISELGLRVQVYGPLGSEGERPLLFTQLYGERQMSDAAMRTPSRVLLTGRVLASTMQKFVRSLEGSNVGRTGMPLVVPTGALAQPASPTPAAPAPVGR